MFHISVGNVLCVYQPVSPDLFGVIEFCRVCNPDFGTIQPVCQTLSVSYCYSLNFVHTLQVYSPPGIRLYFGQGTGQLIICRVSVPINCPMSSKYAVTFWRLDSFFSQCQVTENITLWAKKKKNKDNHLTRKPQEVLKNQKNCLPASAPDVSMRKMPKWLEMLGKVLGLNSIINDKQSICVHFHIKRKLWD